MAFLIDTNIFIDSKNRMPFDLWPTFWSRIAELINRGEIFTIDKVKDEMFKGNDDLVDWVRNNAPKTFFLPIDDEDGEMYVQIQNWAGKQNYTVDAVEEFARVAVADSFLIAKALAKNFTIVTYEKPAPNKLKKIKIPDVCKAFNVKYCDSINDVFRELSVTI